MAKRESEYIAIELLYKKLEKTLSDKENERVERWLEIPAHREYFEHLRQYHQLAEYSGITEEERQQAWVKLHRRLTARSSEKRKLLYKIAAVAAVLLVCAGIWQLYSRHTSALMIKDRPARIIPGRSGALLEMADGKIYNLSDYSTHKIAEHVLVDSSRLDYSGLDTIHQEEPVYNKLTVPRGGEFQIVLSDGTKVWLNAESQLKYPEIFCGANREVYLEGEAYFEVARNPEFPFIVHTGMQKITVLGTSFGITAYSDDPEVSTTLVEGKVRVENTDIRDKIFTLEPGDRIFYNWKEKHTGQEKVNIHEYVAWKDGKYVFTQKRLEDMLNTLSRWYDFQVFYQSPEVKETIFSGELMRFGSFDDILSMIGKSSDLHFTVREHVVIVSK